MMRLPVDVQLNIESHFNPKKHQMSNSNDTEGELYVKYELLAVFDGVSWFS